MLFMYSKLCSKQHLIGIGSVTMEPDLICHVHISVILNDYCKCYFQSSVSVVNRLDSCCRLNAASKTKQCRNVFSNGKFRSVGTKLENP